ncbi:MAG TPA: hypothetical protein VET88_03615 [Gammaproteobacteria bacterium]|nr:hypothetical protein [Gammaproteobacteria bacterium]
MKDFLNIRFSGWRTNAHRSQQRNTGTRMPDVLATVERVVDGTDGRIRLVSGYRGKLQDVIRSSLAFADELVEQIPGGIEVNRHTFVTDPYVNAYFANVTDMRGIFSHSSEIKDFMEGYGDNDAVECCALLCMHMTEKTVLGMELAGDILKKDVRQVAVNFSDHRIYSPAPQEPETRRGLKQCLFDGLVTNALERITRMRLKNYRLSSEFQILKARQRRQQAALQKSGDAVLAAEYQDTCRRLDKLEAELARAPLATPQAAMEQVVTVFKNPEDFVQLRKFSLRLNKMGILIGDDTGQPCNQIDLTEVTIGDGDPRIVTLARFPRSEILPPSDGSTAGGYSPAKPM